MRDVIGIGNAMVDVITETDDDFLLKNGLVKGGMVLIDIEASDRICKDITYSKEMSGGSVGNTMVGLASLGGTGSYVGKISDDSLGRAFLRDMDNMDIMFDTPISDTGLPTARCLVFVTKDGQRSMATYLGSCVELSPADIYPKTIEDHAITYIEGYLWDAPGAKEAIIKCASVANNSNRKVALSLSDSFCVNRHRDSFKELISDHVDVLFANESEIQSLYEESDLSKSIQYASNDAKLVVITLGARGSIVISGNSEYFIEAVRVPAVIDTTGAGDLFAAGFLFGISHGYDPGTSGKIGAACSGEIIGHFGARPECNLSEIVGHLL